jgi:protein-tyrosine phosphatase
MLDLHSHILPGVDDGSPGLETSLEMARAYVSQGVACVACTPHIVPGLHENAGPDIRRRVADLQARLDEAGIRLQLVAGADNHVAPTFVAGLRQGRLLTLADSAYVLVEPPHHVAPLRLEELFFEVSVAGYIPVLTHPERLTWIEAKYDLIERLAARGAWMQVTSGSLRGAFGRRARYWAERMLVEGLVHILASDAHNMGSRRPDLLDGLRAAERLAGAEEAHHLLVTRPRGIVHNVQPSDLPEPRAAAVRDELRGRDETAHSPDSGGHRSFGERLQRFFTNRPRSDGG